MGLYSINFFRSFSMLRNFGPKGGSGSLFWNFILQRNSLSRLFIFINMKREKVILSNLLQNVCLCVYSLEKLFYLLNFFVLFFFSFAFFFSLSFARFSYLFFFRWRNLSCFIVWNLSEEYKLKSPSFDKTYSWPVEIGLRCIGQWLPLQICLDSINWRIWLRKSILWHHIIRIGIQIVVSIIPNFIRWEKEN